MKEFYMDSDGIKLHAKLDRVDENAKGPLCILIHGFTGHMDGMTEAIRDYFR